MHKFIQDKASLLVHLLMAEEDKTTLKEMDNVLYHLKAACKDRHNFLKNRDEYLKIWTQTQLAVLHQEGTHPNSRGVDLDLWEAKLDIEETMMISRFRRALVEVGTLVMEEEEEESDSTPSRSFSVFETYHPTTQKIANHLDSQPQQRDILDIIRRNQSTHNQSWRIVDTETTQFQLNHSQISDIRVFIDEEEISEGFRVLKGRSQMRESRNLVSEEELSPWPTAALEFEQPISGGTLNVYYTVSEEYIETSNFDDRRLSAKCMKLARKLKPEKSLSELEDVAIQLKSLGEAGVDYLFTLLEEKTS